MTGERYQNYAFTYLACVKRMPAALKMPGDSGLKIVL
jgi:hypothetical protein